MMVFGAYDPVTFAAAFAMLEAEYDGKPGSVWAHTRIGNKKSARSKTSG
jgi:hypothetical protein